MDIRKKVLKQKQLTEILDEDGFLSGHY